MWYFSNWKNVSALANDVNHYKLHGLGFNFLIDVIYFCSSDKILIVIHIFNIIRIVFVWIIVSFLLCSYVTLYRFDQLVMNSNYLIHIWIWYVLLVYISISEVDYLYNRLQYNFYDVSFYLCIFDIKCSYCRSLFVVL